MNNKLLTIFIKNITNLSLNQGLNIVVTLLITPILFQRLGENQYGLVNLSFSIVILLAIIVSYGYNLNGPKKIATLKNNFDKLNFLNKVINVRIFIAVLVSIIILIFFSYLGFFKNYWSILFPSLIILFSEALYPLFYLQGKDNLNSLMILNACSKCIYFILVYTLIKGHQDAYLANLFFGLSSFLIYLIFWIRHFKNEKYNWLKLNIFEIKEALLENFNLFLSTVASQIIVNGGIVILSNFVNNSELGQFSLAQRVGLLLRMIPTFLVQSVLQSSSRLNISNKKSLNNYLDKVYVLGITVTLFFALILFFASSWVVFILAGEYIEYSQNILIIIGFIPFFSMLNFKNIVLILINEKNELLNKAIWISAIFMIFISTFGSYYYGGYGLAYALIFSELICYIVHSFLLKKENL